MSDSAIMNIRRVVKYLMIVVLFSNISNAKIRFMSKEKMAVTAEYIMLAKIQNFSYSGKTIRRRGGEGKIMNYELLVIESIKGSFLPGKSFILNTLKFDGWVEDNVELPPVGSDVLLFLEKNEKSELKPVNGIQGVWPMYDGKLAGVGHGTTLEQIREMVQKEVNSCKSEAFTSLVDTAEMQTEAGHYREALEAYRKAYGICPMRDLEEQMAWLMGEVGDEDNNIVKERK